MKHAVICKRIDKRTGKVVEATQVDGPFTSRKLTPGRRATLDTIKSGLIVAMKAFGGERPTPNEDLQDRIRAYLKDRCAGWDISMGEDGRPKRWEDPFPEMRRAAERYYQIVAAENRRRAEAEAERERMERLRAEASEEGRKARQAAKQAAYQESLRTILETVPSVFRSVPLDGARWFLTKDIVGTLYQFKPIERCANSYAVIRRLPEDAKRVVPHGEAERLWPDTEPNEAHGLALVSGEGLIDLITCCFRPAAKPFQAWAWGREPWRPPDATGEAQHNP